MKIEISGIATGTVYFMVAQLVFMVSGYIINVGVGRLLGPAMYGIFGVVIALMTVLNVFMTAGIPQSASKLISEGRSVGDVKKSAVKMQSLLTFIVFVAYLGLAGFIAAAFGDVSLTPHIQLSALLIPMYGFSAIYLSFFNGEGRFEQQAALTTLCSIIKVVSVFGLIFAGFGVFGAILGYGLGQIAGFVWAFLIYRGINGKAGLEKEMIKFATPVILFSMVSAFLMSADLFFVKALMANNTQAGIYTAASTLGRIPYYILVALGISIFPAISKATSSKNHELTKKYIRNSMRYLVLLLAPITLLISATSGQLVKMFYTSIYVSAGDPLAIQCIGFAFMTLFTVLNSVIMGSGRPKVSAAITVTLIPIAVISNIMLIPVYGLSGAATATLIMGIVGFVLSAGYVKQRFGALIPLASTVKIITASLVVFIIAYYAKLGGLLLVAEYAALLALNFGILWLLREVNRDDLKLISKMPGIGLLSRMIPE